MSSTLQQQVFSLRTRLILAFTVVVGTLGDGGKTADALEAQHGFARESIDLVFVDHAKEAYLPDLKLIEPALFLDHAPEAGANFAAAVRSAVERARE